MGRGRAARLQPLRLPARFSTMRNSRSSCTSLAAFAARRLRGRAVRPPSRTGPRSGTGCLSAAKVIAEPSRSTQKPKHSRPWSTSKGVTSASAAWTGWPEAELAPAQAFAEPVLDAGDGQGQEFPQRAERCGSGVDGEGGVGEGGEGDQQGGEAADVVEVTMGDEEVADALQGDAGGLVAGAAARCRWRRPQASSRPQLEARPGTTAPAPR